MHFPFCVDLFSETRHDVTALSRPPLSLNAAAVRLHRPAR